MVTLLLAGPWVSYVSFTDGHRVTIIRFQSFSSVFGHGERWSELWERGESDRELIAQVSRGAFDSGTGHQPIGVFEAKEPATSGGWVVDWYRRSHLPSPTDFESKDRLRPRRDDRVRPTGVGSPGRTVRLRLCLKKWKEYDIVI